MGYMIRRIRERAMAGGYLTAPVRKPRVEVVHAPKRRERTYEELRAVAAKQRDEQAQEERERALQREATRVQRSNTWDKVRTRLGGLFRRKV